MSLQSVSAVTGSPALTSDSVTAKPALPQVELPKIEFKTALKQDSPDLQSAINDANNMLAYVRPDIKFVIDEATNDVVIMLVEPETGDVINRYPTEQALAISNAIVESQARAAEQHAVFENAGNGILGLFVAQKI